MSGPAANVERAVAILQKFIGDAPEKGKGRYFLDHSYRFIEGAAVYYDADPDTRHCVVDIPGSCVALVGQRRVHWIMSQLMDIGFAATRLDIAIDYRGDLDAFIMTANQSAMNGELCRARIHGLHESRSNGEVGRTFTAGKRGAQGSGRYLRLYDKGVETGEAPQGAWIRWEVEYHADCAASVAEQIVRAFTVGDLQRARLVSIENALGAIEFRIANGRSELTRRPLSSWYAELVRDLDTRTVVSERRSSTVEGWQRWIERCVYPAIKDASELLDTTIDELFHYLVSEEAQKRPGIHERARALAKLLGIDTTTQEIEECIDGAPY